MANYMKGNVDEILVISTLAAKTLVSAIFDDTVSERTRISSLIASYGVSLVTQGAGIGPLVVGIAHSDYTDAEIEEWIETTASWDVGDRLATKEIAKRLIRRIGQFETPSTATRTETLNNGVPIKTKLNWTLNTGQTLRVWVYNQGTQPFATTSPEVSVQGHANLWSI